MAPDSAGPRASAFSLWAPVVAYMAVTFGLSSMSSPPAPPHVSDKVEHFFFYGGLALVTLRALAGSRLAGLTRAAALTACLVTSLYGVSDELHQWFVPNRSADPADWVADTLGGITAVSAAMAGGIILRSRRATRA